MAEYLIQGDTLTVMANHARRMKNSSNEMNAAEILEVMSRTQGNVKTTGKYSVEAISHTGETLKSGMYDTGEVFALPDLSHNKDDHDNRVYQGWTCTGPLKNNYVVVGNQPVKAAVIYADNDDAFIVYISNITDGTTIGFTLNSSQLTFDWGDGTVETMGHGTHTYNVGGDYTIKIYGDIKIPYFDEENRYYPFASSSHTSQYVSGLVISKYMTDIRKYYFSALPSLTDICIPIGVKSIENNAFTSCSSLTYVAIPNSVVSFGQSVFTACTNLKHVILPYEMTEIPKHFFQGCTSLTDIILPESITNIGDSAFFNCSSLTSITIPNGVTNIGDSAFGVSSLTSGNVSLETIILPESLINISKCSFKYRRLKNIILLANEVCSTDGDLFGESNLSNPGTLISALTEYMNGIYVPDYLVESYKIDSVWSTYASMIKPLSECPIEY